MQKGLAPANKVGVIDSDYRGEIIVALHNHSDKPVTIEPKDRIAQIVLAPYITASFNEVEELDDTKEAKAASAQQAQSKKIHLATCRSIQKSGERKLVQAKRVCFLSP